MLELLPHSVPTHYFDLINLLIFCSSHKEILLLPHTVPCLRDLMYTVILSSNPRCHRTNSNLSLKFHLKHHLFGRGAPSQSRPVFSYECSHGGSSFPCNTNYIYLVYSFCTFKSLSCMRIDIQYMCVG